MIEFKGFFRAQGTTDYCDSAVICGILSLFEWPGFKMQIFEDNEGRPVRCPESDIPDDKCRDYRTMSRDQILPLAAGYYKKDFNRVGPTPAHVLYKFGYKCPNGDYLSFSHRAHLRKCSGLGDYTWFEKQWLKADILFHSYVTSLREPNQLLCQCAVAGVEFLQYFVTHNKQWKQGVRLYWSNQYGSWRGEDELAEFIINKVEELCRG